jgi:hypothetical protein
MVILLERLSICALFVLISIAGPISACAQDADSVKLTPPLPPYVGTLRGDFTFIKKFVYKQKATDTPATTPPPTQAPDLAEFDSVQTGTLRKDKEIYLDGTSSEIWRSGSLRFVLKSAFPGTVLVASQMLSYYQDPSEFQEVRWVGASSFQGEQPIGDKKCYYYKKGDESAWIDESTHLPLLFDSTSVHVTYAYGKPTSALQLPEICAQKLQQMNRSWSGKPN